MPFLNKTLDVRLDRVTGLFETQEDLVYRGARETWRVAKGKVTDFASIPAIATWLLPKLSPHWSFAAVWHDDKCDQLNAGICDMTSRDVDRTFALRMARELGASWWQRQLLYCGVSWGALFGSRGRRAGWWRRAPHVLLITLAALVGLAVVALLVTGLVLMLIGIGAQLSGWHLGVRA